MTSKDLACLHGQASATAIGARDAKARLAEIVAYHLGKAGVVFDQHRRFLTGAF
jgi:hypothetical protein